MADIITRPYRFASWNVNGLRAVLRKEPSFTEIAEELDADILALQETKLQRARWRSTCPATRRRGATPSARATPGTAVFSREEPLSVRHADSLLPFAEGNELVAEAAREGRVCALEFDRFWFVDVYTPNAQNELARLDVRMAWDDAYRAFLKGLEDETGKPVVTCGDFNVAHEEIDLKNPKSNRGNAGFSDEERAKFTELLNAGFTDTFRSLHPGRDGRLQLVELPIQRPQEQRGLAHRLLPGKRWGGRPRAGRGHPQRHLRLGPLPRHARDRAVALGAQAHASRPSVLARAGSLANAPARSGFPQARRRVSPSVRPVRHPTALECHSDLSQIRVMFER